MQIVQLTVRFVRRLAMWVLLGGAVACQQRHNIASTNPDAASVVDASSGASAFVADARADQVDAQRLRARARQRLSTAGPVVMLQGGSPEELGYRICTRVVPRVARATPILLKPNLGGFDDLQDPPGPDGDHGFEGRITNPEFVRGVIRCLKSRGHTRITIADSKRVSHAVWQRMMDLSGYTELAATERVRLVAMSDDGVFDQQDEQPGRPLRLRGMETTHVPTLVIPKILAEHLESGLVISIPKIKAHRFTVVSVGIKNILGGVMFSDAKPAYVQKNLMHRELGILLTQMAQGYYRAAQGPDSEPRRKYVETLETFAARTVDILEVEAPHIVLAEGTPAVGGDGFHKLWPSRENVTIGGPNAILVDRVAAQFLGLWNNAELAKQLGGHGTSPVIEAAAKRFGLDLDASHVEGNGAPLLRAARPFHFISMIGFEVHSGNEPFVLSTMSEKDVLVGPAGQVNDGLER